MNYNSPKQISNLIYALGLRLKKRWGQNFLVNQDARKKILSLAELKKNHTVWEIGPGLGCLTELIIPRVKKCTLFEIDKGMITYLKNTLSDYKNFIIIAGDVIKKWQEILITQGIPERVLGNLPYSCASRIILSFIKNDFSPMKMIFTIQRELANRMTALPGTKDYSSFSILSQFTYKIVIHANLKAGSFYPIPAVASSIIELTPGNLSKLVVDKSIFFDLVSTLFKTRRKTIKNNILQHWSNVKYNDKHLLNVIKQENIDLNNRAENLQVNEIINLANKIILSKS